MKSILSILAVILALIYCEPVNAQQDLDLFIQELATETSYEDVVINGEVYIKGWGPDCEQRYLCIKQILEAYNRPITVLILRARQGYFPLRIAQDFESTCVMVEQSTQLQKICEFNTDRDNIILLNKTLTSSEVERLSECKHFDVVIALNYLHHENDWEEKLESIMNLGDHIFIESPEPGDVASSVYGNIDAIHYALNSTHGGVVLFRGERYQSNRYSNLYWFSRGKPSLKRKSWYSPLLIETNCHTMIQSDFDFKRLYHYKNGEILCRDWKHGINAETFITLNGAHPSNEIISAIKT